MKKLLYVFLLLISFTTVAQNPKLRLSPDTLKTNVLGQPLKKGDEFQVFIQLHANSNTTVRSLYFDLELQNTAFDFLTAGHTGTGGNGGFLPYGSNITMDMYAYPGYSFNQTQQNTTTDGTTNYMNAQYNYTEGGPKTIVRIYLNWSTASGLPYNEWGNLIWVRFRLRGDAPTTAWDPITLNFAAAYNADGSANPTIMEQPLKTIVGQDPNANKLIKAKLDLSPNIDRTALKVYFMALDNSTGTAMYDIAPDGTIAVPDDVLVANKEYQAIVMMNMAKMPDIYNAAVTVSDYTVAQGEYIRQNLDGTFKNTQIVTGMGYKAADVNFNNMFDGGDLTRMFAQVTGVNPLMVIPSQVTDPSNTWMSMMSFTEDQFNAATPQDWGTSFATRPNNAKFTTPAQPGNPLTLNIKYLLFGDINKSHSSSVVRNNNVVVHSVGKMTTANRTTNNIVDISLKNQTVTSNSIEIPVTVNTNGNGVSALQMEFKYDASKLKFEEMKTDVPEGWYVFANNKDGVIKFGALDKDLKKPFTGTTVPFKLRFSALQNGLTINSFIEVTDAYDAADAGGGQLSINMNTDNIKLTGIKNF